MFAALTALTPFQLFLLPCVSITGTALGLALILSIWMMHFSLGKGRLAALAARQTTPVTRIFFSLAALVPLALAMSLYPVNTLLTQPYEQSAWLFSGIVPLCFLFFLTVGEKRWQNRPFLFSTGCTLCTYALFLGTLAGAWVLLSVNDIDPKTILLVTLKRFFPYLDAATPNLFLLCLAGLITVLLFSMALGAAANQLAIMARRTKDDFGRDYYAYALRTSSIYAACTALTVACITGAQVPGLTYVPATSLYATFTTTAASLMGLAGALWALPACSKNPMRLKVNILAAILLFLLGFALCCIAFFV